MHTPSKLSEVFTIVMTSFAEAQTTLHRPRWDQVLWVLPAGEARKTKPKQPVRDGMA